MPRQKAHDANPYAAPTARLDRPAGPEGNDRGPEGFGGWLLLPMVAAILRPFQLLLHAVYSFIVMSRHADPASGSILIYRFTTHGVLIVLGCVLVILFLRKSAATPATYMISIAAITLVNVLDLLISLYAKPLPAGILNASVPGLLVNVVLTMIWGMYFNVSVRVKNTFVRRDAFGARLSRKSPQPPQPPMCDISTLGRPDVRSERSSE